MKHKDETQGWNTNLDCSNLSILSSYHDEAVKAN